MWVKPWVRHVRSVELGKIVRTVSAEEIVDGYQEKTLTLLWILLGS